MDEKEIIDNVIKIETDKETNDPNDHGGRTKYGISEKSNPGAWADGKVTEDEARAIYEAKYVKAPGFDKIKDSKLKAQLVDFGVNSGPYVAIKKLQEVVGAKQDGVLGPATLEALDVMHADDVNNCLVALRVKMIGQLVSKNPSQLKFINGWLDRAVQFLA